MTLNVAEAVRARHYDEDKVAERNRILSVITNSIKSVNAGVVKKQKKKRKSKTDRAADRIIARARGLESIPEEPAEEDDMDSPERNAREEERARRRERRTEKAKIRERVEQRIRGYLFRLSREQAKSQSNYKMQLKDVKEHLARLKEMIAVHGTNLAVDGVQPYERRGLLGQVKKEGSELVAADEEVREALVTELERAADIYQLEGQDLIDELIKIDEDYAFVEEEPEDPLDEDSNESDGIIVKKVETCEPERTYPHADDILAIETKVRMQKGRRSGQNCFSFFHSSLQCLLEFPTFKRVFSRGKLENLPYKLKPA